MNIETLNLLAYWIGMGVIAGSSIFGCSFILFILFKWTLDMLGRVFPNMRIIIEYSIYRRDYLEWVKDKERLPLKKKK